MGIPNLVRRLCRNGAFRFGLYSGVAGVLVDADHALTYYLPLQFGARPFHPALLLIAGIVIIGVVACLGGLYFRVVLNNENHNRTRHPARDNTS